MMISYGIHAVKSLLQVNPEKVKQILVLKNRDDQRLQALIQLAEQHNVSISFVSRDELDQKADDANHQGIIAITANIQQYNEADIDSLISSAERPPLILILDGVQDPHNLGACMRSADAAGVDFIIAPKDRAVGITATVRKVASGAADNVPFIQVTNLARSLQRLQEVGIWIVGTSDKADCHIYDIDLTGPIAIILGSEEKGLRELTSKHCDYLASIPMQGSVESLNVSVAGGICLFEAIRQRSKR